MRCRSWLYIFAMHIMFRLCSSKESELALQCRDNDNKPADWWYIYKPPSRNTAFLDPGTNFSFIWPGKTVYKGRLAVIVYTESKGFMGTSAMGVLLADDTGAGLWLGHTVPGYPEPTFDRSDFPPGEMAKGHMFACISLTQEGVNIVAKALDLVAPAVTELRLPKTLAPILPAWETLQLSLPTPGCRETKLRERSLGRKAVIATSSPYLHYVESLTKLIYGTTFHSRHGKKFTLMARIPGDKRCLYESFASSRKIVLDVYGKRDDGLYSNICVYTTYGVRNIESISIKYPEEERVKSILDGDDRARFAVSTATAWQIKGRRNNSYWVCVSNLDKEDKRNSPGGMLMCVEDFGIWRAFDNMKVSEPSCDV